jgi:hypothetical protein
MMAKFDYDYIYSLYNDDDDVLLYECLEHAQKAKSRLEEFVLVYGPFQHLRLEKPVIIAAQQAVGLLDRLFDKESELNPWQAAEEVRQVLQKALAEVVLKFESLPESVEKGVEDEDSPR